MNARSKHDEQPLRLGKGSGVEHAYRALRREIVDLTLKPGAALDEVAIAVRLGLSRTPVHEAIVRLASESLVVLLPNRGASVAGMEWDQIRDYIEAYGLLLRLTHRWAALRRTDSHLVAMEKERLAFEIAFARGDWEETNECNWRFHAAIGNACGNGIIARDFRHVLTLSLRIAHLAYNPACFASPEAHAEHNTKVFADHKALVDAITRQDADEAEAIARRHADLARLRIMDTLARQMGGKLDIDLSLSRD